MCCGRGKKAVRNTGKSRLIKKQQQEKNLLAAVPEVPDVPRQEQDSNKLDEQKQEQP